MNINLVQWNISYNCKSDKIINLLKEKLEGDSVICLQEVLQSNKEKIVKALHQTDYAFSLNIRRPGRFDGKNRKLGLLTMSFGGKITEFHLIERSLFPERTLFTSIKFGGEEIHILSFHSLTGVGYKRGKSSQFASIAEYLYDNKVDFFCCDANEPSNDSFEISELEFWDNGDKGKYPSLLFGEEKVHRLEDSLYSVKDRLTELPISHRTGKTLRRYDFIYKSRDWKVEKLEYDYDGGVEATSDHALVIGNYMAVNSETCFQ